MPSEPSDNFPPGQRSSPHGGDGGRGNAVSRSRRLASWGRRLGREILRPGAWVDIRGKRVWIALFFAAYTLAGFFLVPPILQRQIVASLHQALERPVALEVLRINPLLLRAELGGFRVDDQDGQLLVGFDRLQIHFSLASLPRWAWSFSRIRLEGLKGRVIRYGETDTNIGRLISAVEKPSDGVDGSPEVSLARIVVDHLQIVDAMADFTDRVPASPFHVTVGPANIDVSPFSTLPQRTGEQQVSASIEGGATLEWTAVTGLNPFVSTGHVALRGPYVPLLARYFGDTFNLSAPSGALDGGFDYRLGQRPDGIWGLAIEHAGLGLKDLALGAKGEKTPFLSLPEFRLAGGHLAWPERTAGAETLVVNGLDLALQQDETGRLGPASWQPAPGAMPAPAATPLPASPDRAPDWAVTLGKFEARKASIRFEDRMPAETARVGITPLDLILEDLSNQPGASFPLSVTAAVETGGQLGLQGRLSILPDIALDARLTVTDLGLAAGQAYLHDLARLAIDDGRLDGESDIKLLESSGLAVAGHAGIRSLKLRDEVQNTPVVAWDRLALDHYDYRQATNELQISQVAIGAPYLRFQVAADQTTNFSHILRTVNRTAGRVPGSAPPGVSQARPGAGGPTDGMSRLKLSLGKIVVAQGVMDYGDASLPLPFAAHVSDLKGEVASLSSARASPARLALQGQVGDFGQAKIDGRLTPFDPAQNTKINLLFRNVEFPDLSPYTVKFAGRRIAKGRLDVDLRYVIDGGALTGANRVVARDIELGEKLDIPGAMNLPLELAIALLKDKDGRIDVDLPVSGNLKDPQFDIGAVVTRAVFQLLTRLITSPFEALAALLGGGEDGLDHIDFVPGRADLDPPEKEKILRLAKALEMRPHLVLGVPRVTAPEADRQELQRADLDARMTRELGDRDTVKRQLEFLETLFAERIGKDQLDALRQSFIRSNQAPSVSAGELDETGYAEALRDRTARTEPVGDDRLASLAEARAAAVAGALRQSPGIDPKRISLQGPVSVEAGEDGAIALKLDAGGRDVESAGTK